MSLGLYLDPPDKALVFSVDEKSQIQALDRTQPGLPMKKGRAGTMTHDYKRNGTTTLFAALNVATGRVIGQCMKRHRHQECSHRQRCGFSYSGRHATDRSPDFDPPFCASRMLVCPDDRGINHDVLEIWIIC